jgi:hypothetical protein
MLVDVTDIDGYSNARHLWDNVAAISSYIVWLLHLRCFVLVHLNRCLFTSYRPAWKHRSRHQQQWWIARLPSLLQAWDRPSIQLSDGKKIHWSNPWIVLLECFVRENGGRTDLTLFAVCVRYGLLDNGPRRVAGPVNTTSSSKCIACIINWFMKESTPYSFGNMRTLLYNR